MVKINKEDALICRNILMNRIANLAVESHMQEITIDDMDVEVKEIDDFLSRTLGLDPEKIEHWLDD